MTDHHPPHVYLDDTWYMFTASVYRGHRLLQPRSHKELVRDQLKALVDEFKFTLAAWVILDNHYHILIRSHAGTHLPQIVRRLHGRTSHDLNELDGAHGRQVWHNYWDTCIRGEIDFWTRFNYIHNNPVKHGYVRRFEEWIFSSYRYYLETKGQDWLNDCWERYPVIDYLDRDDFDLADERAK